MKSPTRQDSITRSAAQPLNLVLSVENFLRVCSAMGRWRNTTFQPPDVHRQADCSLFQVLTGGLGRVLGALLKDTEIVPHLIHDVSAKVFDGSMTSVNDTSILVKTTIAWSCLGQSAIFQKRLRWSSPCRSPRSLRIALVSSGACRDHGYPFRYRNRLKGNVSYYLSL